MGKLYEFVILNPKETLPKGTISKKIAMDKLQPFTRDILGYDVEPYAGGTKFRNGDTIMARITPCLENGKIAQVNILFFGQRRKLLIQIMFIIWFAVLI